MFRALHCIAQKPGHYKNGAEVLRELRKVALEKNGEDKVVREKVLHLIGEKRTLLNNILRRKVNWNGHILK